LVSKDRSSDFVNTKNSEGNTSLHWAVLNGHYDVVKLLLENGADVDIKNESKHDALYLAEQQKHEKIMSLLLESMKEEEERQEASVDLQHVSVNA
jgi:ankyrin repeat protein